MTEDRRALDRELPRQTNFEDSLALAKSRLAGLDFDEQCRRAGLELCAEGARLWFVNREFLVRRQGLELEPLDQGPPPELWERIIALHYLIHADGSPDAGELITYKQVPDGAPYYAVFQRRTSAILLSAFAGRFPALLAAAEKLGGEEVKGHGDLAFKVRALPRVDYLFVLYDGDDEFPPEITVVFDSSLMRRLSAEDITVLCQMICLKLLRV
jgi:hypothetical protein